MVRLREQLWDFVEGVFKTHGPVRHYWLQAAATSRVEGGCGHPEGWTGGEEFQVREVANPACSGVAGTDDTRNGLPGTARWEACHAGGGVRPRV